MGLIWWPRPEYSGFGLSYASKLEAQKNFSLKNLSKKTVGQTDFGPRKPGFSD